MSGRSGFYFSVVEEGEVSAGDVLELIQRDADSVTVADIVRLYVRDKQNLPLMRRAIEVSTLPAGWRDYFEKRLGQARP